MPGRAAAAPRSTSIRPVAIFSSVSSAWLQKPRPSGSTRSCVSSAPLSSRPGGAAVGRFEAHVARLRGDGVMAYFGWPMALEDAAERAVHAGLGIVAEVERLSASRDLPLAVRVGIATGMVVVGDLEGQAEKG